MASRIAVGIDLGTTNSAAAWMDPSEKTAMLRNSEGDLLTPSVVFFDDAEIVVGKEARRVASIHPDRVAQWVKRDMGSPVYSRPIRGEYFPPEVIQACILRKMKADIAAALGGTGILPVLRGSTGETPVAHGAWQVVLTVPAYFDEPRRKATADAGEMAGLALLDIVNEPTAAALGFGEVLGYLTPKGSLLGEMNVMVYDLGGGTFDATLLRLAPGDIRTLATDGDVQLGGHDWDTRLVNFAAEAFQRAHGRDPRDDPATLNQLFDAAVEAKHTLSARSHATIRIEHAGSVLEVPVTREQFEEMTADLLERTSYTSRQLLAAAGLQWSDVSRVLLVGGSTRMPMVPALLQRITGIVPDRTVNPDEAVARGAAIYAHYLLSSPQQGGAGATFQVTNVNSHSLGVEGIDADTLRKVNVILIPRNTPLPAQVTERFATKSPDQRSIVIQVLEGESSSPGECAPIGRTVIRDLPAGLPKGWPVEVTFAYGTNGRLSVRGVVPGTDRAVMLDMERDVGLSPDGVARLQEAVGSAAGFDEFDAMLQEVLGTPADGPPGKEPPASRPSSVAIVSQPTPLSGGGGWKPAAGAGESEVGSRPSEVGKRQPAVGGEHSASREQTGGSPQSAAPVVFQSLESPGAGHASLAEAAAPGPKRQPPSAGHSAGHSARRWVVSVVGYAVSAAAGIALAYYLVSWLLPGAKLPKLW